MAWRLLTVRELCPVCPVHMGEALTQPQNSSSAVAYLLSPGLWLCSRRTEGMHTNGPRVSPNQWLQARRGTKHGSKGRRSSYHISVSLGCRHCVSRVRPTAIPSWVAPHQSRRVPTTLLWKAHLKRCRSSETHRPRRHAIRHESIENAASDLEGCLSVGRYSSSHILKWERRNFDYSA